MMRIGVGGRRSPRRSGWLPYESSRRLQRDGVLGFVMIAASCLVLLIFGATNDAFTVEFVDGVPQTSDGTPCAVFEAVPVGDSTAPVRAMVDCGDMPGLGFSGVIQHLFLALSAVGVLLLLSAVFSFVLASRMPGDTLVIPVCVAGIVIGVLAVWWGIGGDGPGLAFQGLREQAVVGYLRSGGAVTTREGAVSWGAGLLAASFVRITRP